jgi:hypothetical protein
LILEILKKGGSFRRDKSTAERVILMVFRGVRKTRIASEKSVSFFCFRCIEGSEFLIVEIVCTEMDKSMTLVCSTSGKTIGSLQFTVLFAVTIFLCMSVFTFAPDCSCIVCNQEVLMHVS